jgi:molybdate transport system substrate-binding protein
VSRLYPLACALALACLLQGATEAAELQVLSSNGVTGILAALVPGFEHASGNTLHVHFDTTQSLTRSINDGADFDVAILTHPAVESLMVMGRCGHGADIARSGIGVAVRAGASRPDITTLAAFKAALQRASSVGFSATGASGLYVEEMLQRIGMTQALNAKVQRYNSDVLAARLAAGEVELVIQQISEIHLMPGTDYVGPLPGSLQHDTVFTASVGTHARDPAAAKALVAFLVAPEAAAIIRANWMTPP